MFFVVNFYCDRSVSSVVYTLLYVSSLFFPNTINVIFLKLVLKGVNHFLRVLPLKIFDCVKDDFREVSGSGCS